WRRESDLEAEAAVLICGRLDALSAGDMEDARLGHGPALAIHDRAAKRGRGGFFLRLLGAQVPRGGQGQDEDGDVRGREEAADATARTAVHGTSRSGVPNDPGTRGQRWLKCPRIVDSTGGQLST